MDDFGGGGGGAGGICFSTGLGGVRVLRGDRCAGDWRFSGATCGVWELGTDRYIRLVLVSRLRGRFLATLHKRLVAVDGWRLVLDERRTVGVGDVSLRPLGVRRLLRLAMDAGHAVGARLGFVA